MSRAFACSLASSSAGNATLYTNGKTHILLDAGLSSRALKNALALFSISVHELSAVFITHEHGDHTASLPYLPHEVPVYAASGAASRLTRRVEVIEPGLPVEVNNVCVIPFSTPHDTPDSVGFLLQDGEKRLALATDMGHMPGDTLFLLKTVSVLFLESNYDEHMLKMGRYPVQLKRRIAGMNGHLSNDQCADAAFECARGKLKHLVLMHLSKDNNRPELAYSTTKSFLTENGVEVDGDVTLQTAPRSAPCQPIYI